MKKTTPRRPRGQALSLMELSRFCHADAAWLMELVEYGVIKPKGSSADTWRFQGVNIARAKKARRLHQDLGINIAGVAMVLDLLAERDAVMRRLKQYEPV